MPLFEKFWPPQKNLSTRWLFILFFKYQAMKILLNNLIKTLCNLIVRRVTKEGALVFYNKCLDWDCLKKEGSVDLENISSAVNIKLSALAPLSSAGVEGLCAILFLVKST